MNTVSTIRRPVALQRQRGAAAVEFGLLCLIFLTIVLGILELGRMLYLYNTMQEVSRRGAREAVIRWVDQGTAIKTEALFGGSSVPAGAEITASNIYIRYLNAAGNEVATLPSSPGDNMSACSDITRTDQCIYSVSVSLENVTYVPMVKLFTFLNIALPMAKVTMHAESLGFND
ncbi:TadE/TadG family type IV pilus assembly protein [Massilia sp. YIM B04103]|uniref:TadE/TadG family type IV pilus assembly protein n=1 Tax=Massilia sp. YIM B04103 TaxID=2963106 RepID=UPI00210CB9CB|nr:TadE family protein [Massilia sp. YIM B04103]